MKMNILLLQLNIEKKWIKHNKERSPCRKHEIKKDISFTLYSSFFKSDGVDFLTSHCVLNMIHITLMHVTENKKTDWRSLFFSLVLILQVIEEKKYAHLYCVWSIILTSFPYF